jgi:predicted nuclease of restriction endonuclease-like (RecB) superfamily
MIVERQREASRGESVVENLAKDLQAEFPGIQGFGARNIWRMRDFYLTYRSNEKLTPLVSEIGWPHNLIILQKCKDDLEREFYIRMARKFGWTKNVLVHQIRLGRPTSRRNMIRATGKSSYRGQGYRCGPQMCF